MANIDVHANEIEIQHVLMSIYGVGVCAAPAEAILWAAARCANAALALSAANKTRARHGLPIVY